MLDLSKPSLGLMGLDTDMSDLCFKGLDHEIPILGLRLDHASSCNYCVVLKELEIATSGHKLDLGMSGLVLAHCPCLTISSSNLRLGLILSGFCNFMPHSVECLNLQNYVLGLGMDIL